MTDSLQPHGLNHARLLCTSLYPRICSNSYPLVHWVNDVIQTSYLLSSPSPPALNLFQNQGLFQWVSSNEYSGFISFRIDWLGLLAVQGTVKIILQHHNSKATTVYNLDYFWRLSPLTKSRLFFHYNIFLILEYVHYPICYIAYVGEENFSSTFLNSLAS